MPGKPERIEIRNVLRPESRYRVDARRYRAMRQAMLAALPAAEPGLTVDELHRAVLPLLPEQLFPDGTKAGWWVKAVQLDLEAGGAVVRERTRPLRLRRT